MPKSYDEIKIRKESDPEYAEKLKEYAKNYRDKNIESERERNRKYAADRREKNREAYNAYMREWTQKNAEKVNAVRRERRKKDLVYAEKVRERDRARPKEQRRSARLMNFYGLTLDSYNKMREEQNFSCAICGRHEDKCGKHKLVVDHCHTTGKVRQLLCSPCNSGIGSLKESEEILVSALAYIRKHSHKD